MVHPVVNHPWPHRAVALPVLACVLGSCGGGAELFETPPLHACAGAAPEHVRVMTYNIHSGTLGSLAEITDVVRESAPDVLALQEVDRDEPRSGDVDQARQLAADLGYDFAFAATLDRGDGQYGVALLSRLPFMSVERVELVAPLASEPRVAIDAQLCVGNRPLRVVAVHADVLPWSAAANAHVLARYLAPDIGHGLVVAGDFNALPSWEGPRAMRQAGLEDLVARFAEGATFVGDPLPRRIDYLFADAPVAARARGAQRVLRHVSDHLPVYVDLELGADWGG